MRVHRKASQLNETFARQLLSVFIACAVLAAGCAQHSAEDATKSTNLEQLTIGVTQPVNSLNPVTIVDWEESNFAHFVWAGLLGVNASGHLFPELARSVPTQANGLISGNGRAVTFVLRPGLKWSDGKPLTTTDVRFGWQVATKTWADLCPAVCGSIRNVFVDSARRVTFQLSRPYSPLLFDLPPALPRHQMWRGSWTSTYHFLYQTATDYMGLRFAVSGPYQATASTSTSVTFTRNPEWHILSRPAYAEVVVRSYATDPEMFAAATSGQIDLSQGYQVLDFVGGVLSGSLSGLAMRLFPLGGLEHLEPNITGRYVGHNAIRYLTDRRVREALNLVIDRRKLLHTALDIPWAMTANLPAFGPEIPGRFDGVAVKGMWDPIKNRFVTSPKWADAARLLDEAGWHLRSDGWRYRDGCQASTPGCRLDMTFLVPKVYFNRLREAQFVAQEWKKALGVKVFLDASQWGIGNLVASYEENGPCARGWFDLCLFAQVPGDDPQVDFQLEFPSDRIARLTRHPTITDLNFTGVRDRFIDHIFTEAPTVYDLAKRAALYRAWQIRVAKNADWIPLLQQPFIVLQRETIRGFKPSPTSPEWDPWALAPSG